MEGLQKPNVAEQQKAGQDQNSQSCEKKQTVSPEVSQTVKVEEAGEKTAATEQSKLSEQDKVQWLTDRLAHSVTDLSRTRPDEPSSGTADKGRWVKVSVAVGEETEEGIERQKLASDSDVLTLEQPGRVTG